MNKGHALLIALVVGIAAIAGTIAATKTAHLGQSATAHPKTPSALIAQRTKALNKTEVALRKALKQKPPKLPALPKAAPAAAAPATSMVAAPIPAVAAAPAPQRVVYVRPKPIVVTVHRKAGEYEAERDGGEGEYEAKRDGGEGGFDD